MLIETIQMFFVFLIIIFLVMGLFLLMRKAVLWYFRIDEARENQRKIIALLQRIADKG